ncbi:MAG TPA: cysteine desulfurase [Candidatus Choladousia intestinavium]|uniref:Cysteine desulfurase n=1 Tax=Candidatus Choladousia intestinavium TaxID=2840727 RepID=A0A9D1AAN3_9FIRM|nr:cysteine desulfurase [Candidatus Choladousia intestinavium]
MEAYLDNSATTPCLESVRDIVVKTMMVDYGNPSSRHQKGVEAEHYLRDAREKIAATLKVKEKEIFFTSGGTESNNWALTGAAYANRRAGRHIITTAVEHAAVRMPLRFLEELGFQVTVLPVDHTGHVNPEQAAESVREDTILVSVMMVNNEVGTIEPVEQIIRKIKEKKPSVLFHVDAIQAYGKMRILPKRMGIDLLSVSGHKIHGPKGVGFLYVNEKTKIHPMILGGGQQQGMRSGTDNVPGAAGLGVAAWEAYQNLDEVRAHLFSLKDRMIQGLLKLPEVYVISEEGDKSAPHIVTAAFSGVRSEVLLHALEERKIYVSSGSACSSNKKTAVNSVLQELHLKPALAESTLRFSFSRLTGPEEIDYCLENLKELLPVLRRYRRR